jgi:hypothetical protein
MSALAAASLALIQTAIEVHGVAVLHIPVPDSTASWLVLMHDQRVFAATAFTTLQIPMFVLLVPVLIALDRALDGNRVASVRVATAVGLVGVAVYLATQPSAAMLDLSDRYASSVDAAERAQLVASADSLLALYQGPGLSTGALLVMGAIGVLSALMRGNTSFGPAVAWLGLACATVGLSYFVGVAWPDVRIYLLEVSGAIFVLWLVFTARRLFALGRLR